MNTAAQRMAERKGVLNANPDTFRRCDDDALPPEPILAFLMACWLEGEALEFEGERYRAVWRLRL